MTHDHHELHHQVDPLYQAPDRGAALVIGLFGGLIGAVALRLYENYLESYIMPPDSSGLSHVEPLLGEVLHLTTLDSMSLVGTHYEPGEDASEAAARLMYRQLVNRDVVSVTDVAPSPITPGLLKDVIQWTVPIVLGGVYGGTRTTTASHDLAGGFFYGLRLWLGDTFGLALFGLRAGPTALPVRYHVKRLLRVWVYSFVTTGTTRLLYTLIK